MSSHRPPDPDGTPDQTPDDTTAWTAPEDMPPTKSSTSAKASSTPSRPDLWDVPPIIDGPIPRDTPIPRDADPREWPEATLLERRQPARPRPRWLPRWLTMERFAFGLLGLIVLIVVGVFIGTGALGDHADHETADKAAIGQAANQQAAKVLQFCAVGNEFAQQLADHGLCSGAAAVKSKANEAGVTATGAAPAVAPVDETTLRNYVQAAQASYCATHHDCTPDADSVIPIVADYLRAHPATAPDPTAEQVRPVVEAIIAADPDAFRGKPGQDAPPVSDAQIAAQVAAYCGDGRCVGRQGPQGIYPTRFEFARDQAGACILVVTLVDPATGDMTTTTAPAGEAACPGPGSGQPPATTTTTTTPAGLGGLLGGG